MPTIVLLVAPTIVPDEALTTSTHALANRLGGTLIIMDTPVELHERSVDLVLWMPGPFDAVTYSQLRNSCSRIMFLKHVKTRTGRMATPGGLRDDLPGIVTGIAPFYDIEETCSLIELKFGWPPQNGR
jgi:hypothetical protein